VVGKGLVTVDDMSFSKSLRNGEEGEGEKEKTDENPTNDSLSISADVQTFDQPSISVDREEEITKLKETEIIDSKTTTVEDSPKKKKPLKNRVIQRGKPSKKSTPNEKLSFNGGLLRTAVPDVPFFLRNNFDIDPHRFKKAEETLHSICKLRKFSDIKSDDETLIVKARCGEKHVFMKIFKTFNVRIAEEEIRGLPFPVTDYECIVFVMDKFSSAFVNSYVNSDSNRFSIFEYFLIDEIQFDVTMHVLQPTFELVENDVFYCDLSQLPQFLKTDIICRFHKFPSGAVIKITRKIQGEDCVWYRVVDGMRKSPKTTSSKSAETTATTTTETTLGAAPGSELSPSSTVGLLDDKVGVNSVRVSQWPTSPSSSDGNDIVMKNVVIERQVSS